MNSVCVATYNGENYIVEQLQSILTQIAPEDEVIICDDCSTDRTVERIEALADPRIRILYNGTHYFRDTFEKALRAAQGDLIFLSDQDDVWLEGKYRSCVEALQHVDLVCTNSKLVNSRLEVINEDFFSIYGSGPGIMKNIVSNTYYGSCMAFRRSLLEAALPFPPTHEIGHDTWLGLVAEGIGKVQFIRTPYLLYRRHSENTTVIKSFWSRSKRPLRKRVMSRVIVLYYISKYYLEHAR